jgi:hypothetical protein
VYQGNRLQGKRTRGSGMKNRKMQWEEMMRSPLASIARKRGMMTTVLWQLHPEKRPKWFKENKGRQTVAMTRRPTDLGSDSGDESKVSLVGMKGKLVKALIVEVTCFV